MGHPVWVITSRRHIEWLIGHKPCSKSCQCLILNYFSAIHTARLACFCGCHRIAPALILCKHNYPQQLCYVKLGFDEEIIGTEGNRKERRKWRKRLHEWGKGKEMGPIEIKFPCALCKYPSTLRKREHESYCEQRYLCKNTWFM